MNVDKVQLIEMPKVHEICIYSNMQKGMPLFCLSFLVADPAIVTRAKECENDTQSILREMIQYSIPTTTNLKCCLPDQRLGF